MKKILYIALIFTLSIGLISSVQAHNINNIETLDSNNEKIDMYSKDVSDALHSIINNGGKIYYGQGTTSPSYLNSHITRSIPTDEAALPSSGGVFDFTMAYGNTYYSPFLFVAEEDCIMKIHRTCSYDYDSCKINLIVKDFTTGGEVFNGNLNVSVPGTYTNINITEGHKYYLIVTPLTSGTSFASFVVTGQ